MSVVLNDTSIDVLTIVFVTVSVTDVVFVRVSVCDEVLR